MEVENKVENKKFTNDQPLTETYMSNGSLIEVYGFVNIEVLAKALLNYYNKRYR